MLTNSPGSIESEMSSIARTMLPSRRSYSIWMLVASSSGTYQTSSVSLTRIRRGAARP
jgi:hypothetical protein